MRSSHFRVSALTAPTLPSRSTRIPVRRPLREDLIFRAILPLRILVDEFDNDSPEDWGSKVLSEGDLRGSLIA